MLQEIAPHKLNNGYASLSDLPPDGESLLLQREDSGLWCRITEGVLEVPKVREVYGEEVPSLKYLIAVDSVRFYMAEEEPAKKLEELGFSLHTARELRYTSPAWLRFGTLTAWQAAGWYRSNRFCGRCGGTLRQDEKERMLKCPDCGNVLYPKLCPVVITGVISGDRILLTKYASRGAYANFALVAGFAEIGETIEETVRREVLEETGLKVKNLRYYKSQPWAYSDSLLFGFFCEVDGSDEAKADGEELSTAVWTAREEVPDYGDEISLTYEMMSRFKAGDEITRYQ